MKSYAAIFWFLTLAFLIGSSRVNASDAPAAASTNRPTVLVLGDSLAAGFGLDISEAFPALLQKHIDSAGLKFAVVNAGLSGDTSAGGLRRIDWLLKRPVEVLILELGGNDGLRGIPVATTRTNLQSIIDRTKQKYPQAKVVVAGMQMPPNMGEDYNGPFQRIFPELARANKAALIPFLLEGVGGKPKLNLPDLIHPTAEGQKMVATNVWKILRPVLEKSAAASAR
jgi:acyl-CoA thioesterase-1